MCRRPWVWVRIGHVWWQHVVLTNKTCSLALIFVFIMSTSVPSRLIVVVSYLETRDSWLMNMSQDQGPHKWRTPLILKALAWPWGSILLRADVNRFCRSQLAILSNTVGLGGWMFARTEGIVLFIYDKIPLHAYKWLRLTTVVINKHDNCSIFLCVYHFHRQELSLGSWGGNLRCQCQRVNV